jgi:glycosyltransferase involved in cell wall biosynthesis
VLSVAFANKYTGAAAVAEHCCRALHDAGNSADFLFVSGRNLEARLQSRPWAHADLRKERTPVRILQNLQRLRSLAFTSDVVISNLPHDHVLCAAAGIHRRLPMVRNIRNRRHLRHDPWHRSLMSRISGVVLAHSGLVDALRTVAESMPHIVLPVPVEARFNREVTSGEWRRRLEITDSVPIVGMVGKIAPGRGFDLLLRTAALLEADTHVVAVGHGEDLPKVERLASELGIAERVSWVGYQEEELPALLATMDVVLFTAAGSDHGHRAVTEAQACARPVVAAAIDGVEDLITDGVTGRVVDRDAEALAAAVGDLIRNPDSARTMADQASKLVSDRRFEITGNRLAAFLHETVGSFGECRA